MIRQLNCPLFICFGVNNLYILDTYLRILLIGNSTTCAQGSNMNLTELLQRIKEPRYFHDYL